ncbi:MAG: helix-turn-helix domain-containing protein [Caldilinea sp.]
MDATKQAQLEAQGWKVGSVDEFLELTPEESMLIEIKLALASSLRQRRRSQMTQAQLARKIESSQPRVARAEQGDLSVSFDLLLRAMLATGATPQEIGRIIAEAAE